MSFIKDFKEFAFKGNLIDMAVGLCHGDRRGRDDEIDHRQHCDAFSRIHRQSR